MKEIQLWSVETSEEKLRAEPIENVDNTETEQNLEDLLTSSPDLLMSNLTLVGRQIPTEGGRSISSALIPTGDLLYSNSNAAP